MTNSCQENLAIASMGVSINGESLRRLVYNITETMYININFKYKRLFICIYIQLFSTAPVPKKVQRQLSLLNVARNWDGTMHSGTL